MLFPVFALYRIKRECCFDVYRIAGNHEKWYCTSNAIDPYIMSVFFPGAHLENTGRIYIWNVPAFVRNRRNIIVDMDMFFSFLFPDAVFTFPWIQQVLDLNIPINTIMKHIRERKKISQYGCEISQDPQDLRFYYETMYIPFIRERFAEQAVILEIERIRFLLPEAEVLFVTESGQRIGGAIGVQEGDIYRWLSTAITDEQYRKKGALSAAYYFGILRAKETGARSIDLGLSRPFLSDGVALHKRKWRATMKLENQTRRWFLLSNLEKEHLIVLIDGALTALVTSWDDPIIKHYRNSGIAIKIITSPEKSA
ncbi:MAG: hypothetical protein APR53_05135 [Methanoculleus sp. SDB]|nr:MAG: hypothetical protein APR53_05135 [Methanoculleus sp. SDB]